jgi:hypothetical protein
MEELVSPSARSRPASALLFDPSNEVPRTLVCHSPRGPLRHPVAGGRIWAAVLTGGFVGRSPELRPTRPGALVRDGRARFVGQLLRARPASARAPTEPPTFSGS